MIEQPISPPDEDLCPYCGDAIMYGPRKVHKECLAQYNYDNGE
jgi:hypothetical protein